MRMVILNFHGLEAPARNLETGEERYWVSADLLNASLKLAKRHANSVNTTFTFDDGNASDYTIAAPILAKHNTTATFFVIADRIEKPGSLSSAQIRSLVQQGHRIGSHGASHVDWSIATDAALDRELGAFSRNLIHSASDEEVTDIAIPFGRYSARVLAAIASYGYQSVYSSDGGAWKPTASPYPRTSISNLMTVEDIENIILGIEPLQLRIRRSLTRVVKRIV